MSKKDDERKALELAIARRLATPPGELFFDPDMGLPYVGIDYGASDQADALMYAIDIDSKDTPNQGTFSNTLNAKPLTAEAVQEMCDLMKVYGGKTTGRPGASYYSNVTAGERVTGENGRPVIDVEAVCATCKGEAIDIRGLSFAEMGKLKIDESSMLCRGCRGLWPPKPKELTP